MRFTDAVPFQTHWKFAKTRAAGVEKPSFRDEAFEDVTLPHDWQIGNTRDPGMELGWSQGYYPRYEIGWYRKTFDAPEAWRDKSILLIIDGCQRFYDVYLNGERIGGHRYGYLPDAYALDAALRPGETNCLCVRVDNAHGLGDRWYSGAGLYRGVRLLVKDRSHFAPWSLIAQPEIAEDRAAVRVCARIDGPAEPLTAECELKAPDGTLLARESTAVSEGAVSLTLRPETVRRWDVTDPVLYDLELRLKRDDQVIDTAQERIGFREARFDGDLGFLLNGRILKLYGANLHHDGGMIFGAALPEEVLRRRLTTLKSMGCNAIRCSHNPHAEFLYDLCDEMGLVVIDELYDKWCDSQLYFEQLFSEDHMRDLERMIARDRNHPSVILWSVGNELEVQYRPFFYEKLREMVDACHRLDPSRPVSLALIGFCMRGYLDDETDLKTKLDLVLRYAEIVDVFMGNYMEGYYTALREAGMRKAIIGSEVFTYYRNEELSAFHTVARSPWRDVRDRPYVAGGFVWAGVDYLGEAGDYPSRGWSGCPVDSTGFRKLRAWYVDSQWQDAPVLKLGFLDDTAYDDCAASNWGFPLMHRDWFARRRGLFQHVCVMTNCDEVRLYLNHDPVRACRKYGEDGMMHLLVPFAPGELRAEGWKNGSLVAEEHLYTGESCHSVQISCEEQGPARPGEILQVDLCLLDEHGQLWTRTSPEFTVSLTGGELLGLDNGDLLAPDRPRERDHCAFHLGHAIAYIRRLDEQELELTVSCGSLRAAKLL